jgi:DEAD/DEAH box helicase domain-containing protein
LDAVLVAGFPGTRASFWQQAGRAGRSSRPALVVLVARDDPLDTYLVHHPSALLGAPVEGCVLDPTNPYVLGPHLVCAAAESPLLPAELDRLFGPSAVPVLDALVADGVLRRRPAGWYWPHLSERPAGSVDIRGGSGGQVAVVEADTGRMLGTVDSARAPAQVHPGAVYLHRGASFVVDSLELDPDGGLALVHADDPDWSTSARSVVEVDVVEDGERVPAGPVWAAAGVGAARPGADASGAGTEASGAVAEASGPGTKASGAVAGAGAAGAGAEACGAVAGAGAAGAGAEACGAVAEAGTGADGPGAGVTVRLGEVTVTSQVVSYIRRRRSGEMIDTVPLDMPAQTLRTRAVWYTIEESLLAAAGLDADRVPGALHAAEHAAIGLLPLFAVCDRWDIGGMSTALHGDTGTPTVFVYDGYPGGAGFAERGFSDIVPWLSATRAAIRDCECKAGCPSCVQSPKCGNGKIPLDKAGAVVVLDIVLGALAEAEPLAER